MCWPSDSPASVISVRFVFGRAFRKIGPGGTFRGCCASKASQRSAGLRCCRQCHQTTNPVEAWQVCAPPGQSSRRLRARSADRPKGLAQIRGAVSATRGQRAHLERLAESSGSTPHADTLYLGGLMLDGRRAPAAAPMTKDRADQRSPFCFHTGPKSVLTGAWLEHRRMLG